LRTRRCTPLVREVGAKARHLIGEGRPFEAHGMDRGVASRESASFRPNAGSAGSSPSRAAMESRTRANSTSARASPTRRRRPVLEARPRPRAVDVFDPDEESLAGGARGQSREGVTRMKKARWTRGKARDKHRYGLGLA
jgi:hypothetical protein